MVEVSRPLDKTRSLAKICCRKQDPENCDREELHVPDYQQCDILCGHVLLHKVRNRQGSKCSTIKRKHVNFSLTDL